MVALALVKRAPLPRLSDAPAQGLNGSIPLPWLDNLSQPNALPGLTVSPTFLPTRISGGSISNTLTISAMSRGRRGGEPQGGSENKR